MKGLRKSLVRPFYKSLLSCRLTPGSRFFFFTKKFPTFYVTRRFITMFAGAFHFLPFLIYTNSVRNFSPHNSKKHLKFILLATPKISTYILYVKFPYQKLLFISLPSHTNRFHASLTLLDFINWVILGEKKNHKVSHFAILSTLLLLSSF
jgi:hypothetical protein